jgi:putative spermidine/putrescine transport system substrate-binding protein
VHQNRVLRATVAIAAVGLLTAACSSGSSSSGGASGSAAPGGAAYAGPVGQGEGQVSVLDWPGYVMKDPKNNLDWVTPFEQESGCKVTVKDFGTSAEAVDLFSKGGYDVVSASGDASLRLVYGDYVQPINTSLVPNYADIFAGLKDKPWNSVNGVTYGVPQGRGANLLLFNKAASNPAPASWKDMWDANSPLKGKVSPYDDSMTFADAAVYLMATKPDLGIKNPYALDQTQFQAVVDAATTQKALVAEYWSDYTKQAQALATGSVVQGQGWQLTANAANTDAEKVGSVKPTEGSTGWSDSWMIAKDTKNINCAYKFVNYIVSPKVNAQVAEYFGEAPANEKSCALTANKDHCAQFHAKDDGYWDNVWYWTTPTATCLDGRTDVQCVAYKDWVAAWTKLRSS